MFNTKFTKIRIKGLPGFLPLFFSALLFLPVWTRQQATMPPAQQQTLDSLDIPALIGESDCNGAAMHQRLLEFTYIQKRTTREAGPKGKLIERVREFEAYPVKTEGRHRHVLSLIKKDGVPLSEKQIEQNRQLAAAEMEKAASEETAPDTAPESKGAEKYITAGIGIGPDQTGEGVWLGVSQFLRQCRFEAPRLAQFAGREAIALRLYSCSGAPTNPRENYIAKLTGTVWIDAADKVVVRLEAWPKTSASGSAQTGNEVIVYEQQRIQGGIWAPRRIRLNGFGNAAVFNGVDKDLIFEFMDYRHFSTEIKDTEIVAPKKKPFPH